MKSDLSSSKLKLQKLFNKVINFIYPECCALCTKKDSKNLCDLCFEKIYFLNDPYICDKCGYPICDKEKIIKCYNCIEHNFLPSISRSLFIYNDLTKKIISMIKYQDKLALTYLMIDLVVEKFFNLIEEYDLIIGIPINYYRLLNRQHNYVCLIAKKIASRFNNLRSINNLIYRDYSPPQFNLSKIERMINLEKVFKINPSYVDQIQGKRIIIFDDIITTGSTINSCTSLLIKNGVKSVCSLSLAITPTSKH